MCIRDRLESNCASYIKNDNDNNYINNTIAPYYGGWENIPQNIIDNYDTYNAVSYTHLDVYKRQEKYGCMWTSFPL